MNSVDTLSHLCYVFMFIQFARPSDDKTASKMLKPKKSDDGTGEDGSGRRRGKKVYRQFIFCYEVIINSLIILHRSFITD